MAVVIQRLLISMNVDTRVGAVSTSVNVWPGRIAQVISGLRRSSSSHHLKVLAQVRLVLVEHAGTSSHYQVNPNCLAAFPAAADAVMGRRSRW
jgi:DNA-binding transcriptional ArsR family regulator